MSFEEKKTWIYGVLAAVVPGVYFVIVLGQLRSTAITEIAYERPMLTAIGVSIVLSIVLWIVLRIVVAMASPKEADKKDERDTNINRFGEYVGSHILGIGAVGALGLAMAQYEHFWIANAIYLAFVLQALTSSAVKLVAYRRGL